MLTTVKPAPVPQHVTPVALISIHQEMFAHYALTDAKVVLSSTPSQDALLVKLVAIWIQPPVHVKVVRMEQQLVQTLPP